MTAPILILDGGLGTTLEQAHGQHFTSSQTPLWSSHLLVSDQNTLLACQDSFGRVPVDIILTATYQVSIKGFKDTKTAEHPNGIGKERIGSYVGAAVRIADKVLEGGRAKGPSLCADEKEETVPTRGVALSVGPYGACMIPGQEYSGNYDAGRATLEGLVEWHSTRMDVFEEGINDVRSRVRWIALETIPRADEVIAMRRALASTTSLSRIPFWTSCLFPHPTTLSLPDGSSVEQAVRAMLDPSLSPSVPSAIGINCTKSHKLDPLVHLYESAVGQLFKEGLVDSWPGLVLYPDGTNGEVYNTTTQVWEASEAMKMGDEVWEKVVAEAVRGTRERGEWNFVVVGGCCMASPEHIKRLRDELS